MGSSFIGGMVIGGEQMKHKMVGLLLCGLVGWAVPGAAWAAGAVYAMTNALGNNEIVVYRRANDGTLTLIQTVATGGGGSGVQLDPTDSLGSQGGVVLNQTHTFLFVVNTESLDEDTTPGGAIDIGDCQEGTISSFRVAANGRLTLVDQVPSGGLFPASLAVNGDLLYVLNAGGPGRNPVCGTGPNITGFRVQPNGKLRRLANSTQPINPGPEPSPVGFLNCEIGGFPVVKFQCGLNPPAFPRSPAQVGFSPDGSRLVVTVKGTNTIYIFPLDKNGRPGTPTRPRVSNRNEQDEPTQPTPFGFAFDGRGHLIVTEPFGTARDIPSPGTGAVSSFAITETGALEAISRSVPNGQGTSCWIALDPSQQYAYIGNNAGRNISSYGIDDDGRLTLLEAVAAARANGLPNDLAVAQEEVSSFLYVLYSGTGEVGAYRINLNDGSLTPLGAVGGLPADAGAQGLAAY